jgi:hypothetical protein
MYILFFKILRIIFSILIFIFPYLITKYNIYKWVIDIRDSIVLENKRISQWACIVYFNLWRKIRGSSVHTMLDDIIHSHNYSLLVLPYKYTWAAKELPMLMWSGPSRSRAHSGLASIPSFTVGPFVDAFHILPMVAYLAWLSLIRVQYPKSQVRMHI